MLIFFFIALFAFTAQLTHGIVVVSGATGRVGSLVVERLLQNDEKVVALSRDPAGAEKELQSHPNLTVLPYSADSMTHPCQLVHCADSDAELPELTATFARNRMFTRPRTNPSIVMLSSAAVTRPSWSPSKASRLAGAHDIPIVRLNPGGVLGKKVAAEKALRRSRVPYAIVRPVGLKDSWPSGRPVFSQGDVAVGRTNPDDLAKVLVGALQEPEATYKTFEMLTLTGYPAPRSLSRPLAALSYDGKRSRKDEGYALLQQLLPGEEQDAQKLEMGRSYEAVDSGQVGAREPLAEPTAREKAVAKSVEN